jgi:hypothetical protein
MKFVSDGGPEPTDEKLLYCTRMSGRSWILWRTSMSGRGGDRSPEINAGTFWGRLGGGRNGIYYLDAGQNPEVPFGLQDPAARPESCFGTPKTGLSLAAFASR